MRLADFILANHEPILGEWEAFAQTCAPASGTMDIEALRDHAAEMLTAIAEDLRTPQGRHAQSEKSKGRAPASEPGTTTAAGAHGVGRAVSGFTVEQMIAEYRALRASVIRLWSAAKGALVATDLEDLIRFDEAIDQSLAEAISRYNENIEQSKEVFVGILGHDLRTPLSAIATSASVILEAGALDEPYRGLVERIAHSAMRTIDMVGDLLDFTRSRLGEGIPIVWEEMNLADVVRGVVDEVSAANPACPIRVDVRGEQRGEWDEARLRQALGNLIGNAVQHGAEGTEVTVEVVGADSEVAIAVHNMGEPIRREQLDGLFNPMKPRESARDGAGPTQSLGLGLYIAERIVSAHGGHIDVESSTESGTAFTMHLPRGAR